MKPDFIRPEHPENPRFVFIDEVVPGVRWDAKYATWDNFTGKPVDGYKANRIVGTPALCGALEKARTAAATEGFGLLLWDGYRPQRAVDRFLRWSQEPEDYRTKARHYPNIDRTEIFPRGYVAARSGHSRGSTIDLTIYHLETGELARMGGGHDLMDVISSHDAPRIGPVATCNRQRLRKIMENSGFAPYNEEWWHYSLRDEPYPDTYFNFPIECTRPRPTRARRHHHGHRWQSDR